MRQQDISWVIFAVAMGLFGVIVGIVYVVAFHQGQEQPFQAPTSAAEVTTTHGTDSGYAARGSTIAEFSEQKWVSGDTVTINEQGSGAELDDVEEPDEVPISAADTDYVCQEGQEHPLCEEDEVWSTLFDGDWRVLAACTVLSDEALDAIADRVAERLGPDILKLTVGVRANARGIVSNSQGIAANTRSIQILWDVNRDPL